MSKRETDGSLVQLPLEQLSPLMQECLSQGQEVVLTVTGNSMSPFLRHQRDQVVLKAADPAALQPGDVPLYRRRNGQYVLHRIVERDDGCIRTRWGQEQPLPSAGEGLRYTMLGDAQWQEEPGIAPDQIIACAAAFLRLGRRWDCHCAAYQRNRLRWHRLLPLRRFMMFFYHLPGRIVHGIPRRIRRLLGK